MCLKKNNINI